MADLRRATFRGPRARREGGTLASLLPAETLRGFQPARALANRGGPAVPRAGASGSPHGSVAGRESAGDDRHHAPPHGAIGLYLVAAARAAARRHARQERPGRRRAIRRPRELRRDTSPTPALVQSDRQQLLRCDPQHGASRCRWRSSTRTRSRGAACPRASSRRSRWSRSSCRRSCPAIGLVYLFGNQGLIKGLAPRTLDLRADRYRDGGGLLHLPPRAPDHPHRARRSPTRGSTRRRWRCGRARAGSS